MDQLDITQQKTKKGHIHQRVSQHILYFFVHTLPSLYGEKASICIVDNVVKLPNLPNLILQESIRKSLKDSTSPQSGLILVES